jgi:ParB family chromosome partitioning protein
MQSVDDQNSKSETRNTKFGLGRGLDSLIPTSDNDDTTRQEAGELKLNPALIDPNPHQPRTSFDEAPLAELAASIREYGILQPLLVTKAANGRYQLIAGERRLRASKLAGLTEVPVIVRSLEEQQKLEFAIIENVQRENLNPVEAALSYRRLIDEFNLSQEEAAKKVGKARSTVANALRLLSLPAEIKQGLTEGKITEGHARSILAIEDREAQLNFYHNILSEGMNVRQAESHVQEKSAKVRTKVDPHIRDAEKKMSEAIGTKVKIKPHQVVIEYYNEEDLDKILGIIIR